MKAKEQFKELNKEIKFIVKGEEYYRPIYLDVENRVLRVKAVKPPKTDKLDSRTKTYEEVNQRYTIEVAKEIVTPDMYYMDKIGKNGVYNSETIREKRFIRYVTEHKEECAYVYDRLKEIALSDEKKSVKKAAYDVITEIWGEDVDLKQAYRDSYVKKTKKPEHKERDEKEKELMKILSSDEYSMKNKKKAVRAYHSATASHKFKVFMNRFCLKQCKDKILLNDCVSLCKRTNILNLQNNKPIEYCFCEGSGKRKQTMNRVKRARNRRTGNAKKKK